jgi:hypothetical protein
MARRADGPPSRGMGFGRKAAIEQGIPPDMVLRDERESVRRANSAKSGREESEAEAALLSKDVRLVAYADELRRRSPPLDPEEVVRLLRERAARYVRESVKR